MSLEKEKNKLYKSLSDYKKRYLKERYSELDESATRLMVNSFLIDVLGYVELEEIRTEYRIKGEYADYVIQLAKKKHFIVEVKAIQIDLTENHLRQALNYAANEGVDWVLLTNGRQIQLHKVIFAKPIDNKRVFNFNLTDPKELRKSVEFLVYLTKKAVIKNELDKFWKRFSALEYNNLSKNLYSIEVVRFLKRTLKKNTGLLFNDDDILDSINKIITTKIESIKPKVPLNIIKKKRIKKEITIKFLENDNQNN
jgi:hypothetical protein